jgi:protein-disulfide isomerase
MKTWAVSLVVAVVACAAVMDRSGRRSEELGRIDRLEAAQVAMRRQLDAVSEHVNSSGGAMVTGRGAMRLAIPRELVSTAGVLAKGASTAKVALIEFADFYCPFCRRYAQETAPLIQREFVETGRLQYMVWPLPFEGLHPNAYGLAVAEECANRQGKAWEMREWLFGAARPPAPEDLAKEAAGLGLNPVVFGTCRANRGVQDQIRLRVTAAREMEVTSTPTFFIGMIESGGNLRVAIRLSGAQPFPVFKGVIEKMLASRE